MNPIEKLEELRGIVLGDKIDHPAWDWMNAKFNSLRDDIAAQQKMHPTAFGASLFWLGIVIGVLLGGLFVLSFGGG